MELAARYLSKGDPMMRIQVVVDPQMVVSEEFLTTIMTVMDRMEAALAAAAAATASALSASLVKVGRD